MIKASLSVVRVAAFCLSLALVASCGGEANPGTSIRISPSGVAQGGTATAGNGFVYFEIAAIAPGGIAQVGAKLSITSPYLVYAGQFTCDPITLLCTPTGPPLTPPIEGTTDSGGTYGVTVLYDWSANATGAVTALGVFSGTSYGKVDITFAP